MTAPIRWAEARSSDQQELQQFICTPPPPPMAKGTKDKHRHLAGSHWEREVQTGINHLKPPVPSSELLLIGRDDEGIVAVSHSFQIGDPDEFKVLAAAVALRARRRQPPLGDELLNETLLRLTERADAAEMKSVAIWGLVHSRNAASQALVERNGFDYISEDKHGYQEWWQFIDLSQ